MGKYALSEIWRTLFIREKLFLTTQVVLFHQAHAFWTTGTWVSEEEKDHFWGRCTLLVWRPFWLWYLLTLSSTSFHCPSLFPFLSPHIHSVYWPPQMWESVSRFMYFFSCSPPVAAAGENFREHTSVVSSPRLALMFPYSAVDMQCSVLFTFQCYRLFPDAWAFCLISSCLNSFSASAYHCAQCLS